MRLANSRWIHIIIKMNTYDKRFRRSPSLVEMGQWDSGNHPIDWRQVSWVPFSLEKHQISQFLVNSHSKSHPENHPENHPIPKSNEQKCQTFQIPRISPGHSEPDLFPGFSVRNGPMTLDMLAWRLQLRLENPAALRQLRWISFEVFFSQFHQGLGLMSLFGDLFHITKPNICWRLHNSWVMWNIETFTTPCPPVNC